MLEKMMRKYQINEGVVRVELVKIEAVGAGIFLIA